jgi:hypothetical protein
MNMKHLARLIAVGVLAFFATTALAQFSNAQPNSGACFYTDFNFRGESFCMNAGQDAPTVPSSFNDRIRSIRVFGRAQVNFYNDSAFRGTSGSTSRDISDLRQVPLPNVPSKNWETRISSIQVRGGGFGGGYPGDYDRGGYDRRDRDRNRGDRDWHSNSPTRTVNCSSDLRRDREWCNTLGGVNSVRVVNENGRADCEWNRTFGIDSGRLWVGRGCAGSFEVR